MTIASEFLPLPEPGSFKVFIPGIGEADAEVGAGTPFEKDSYQKYPIGTILRRGWKTFVYCYAGGNINTEWGAYKAKKTNTVAVAPTQSSTVDPVTGKAAGVAGSYYVTVTIDAAIGHLGTGVLWKNELAGGEIVIGNGTSQHPQQRTIVSHPALASTGGSLTVRLDSPLERAVTAATTTIELMESPFQYIKADGSGGDYVSFLGMPTVEAVSGEFFWLQTYGPRWITSDGNTCDSAGDRTLVFKGNGSIVSSNDITVESGIQVAGFAWDMSGSGASNAPMVFLTLMR